jgi:aspartyl-tRNA(Asn)/glutamyl-tRNA(Gln) amidotransferase subunit A
MALATAADTAFASGSVLGPLQGVPVSLKDLYAVKGVEIYAGTPKALPDRWQTQGPVVSGLRGQLAVIAGKTHTVELAFGGLGVNNHWGTPRNPWDKSRHRVPGGSSSGAGVSLWEGSALLALGTDTAGSVRIPASMTGCVGLKTSFGRWSLAGIVPLSSSLDSAGILTRSVADAVYGFASIDHRWQNPEQLSQHMEAGSEQVWRLARGPDWMWEGCDPGIAECVEAALSGLTASPSFKSVNAPLPEAWTAVELLHKGSVASAECDAFLCAELPQWRDSLDPMISARIRDGGAISAGEYLSRKRQLEALTAAGEQRLVACDVMATPTVSITPPLLEEVTDLEAYRPRNLASLRNTCVGNSLSLCAISLPVGVDRAGMPVGLQLLARHGREATLLCAALAAEKVIGTPLQCLGLPPHWAES